VRSAHSLSTEQVANGEDMSNCFSSDPEEEQCPSGVSTGKEHPLSPRTLRNVDDAEEFGYAHVESAPVSNLLVAFGLHRDKSPGAVGAAGSCGIHNATGARQAVDDVGNLVYHLMQPLIEEVKRKCEETVVNSETLVDQNGDEPLAQVDRQLSSKLDSSVSHLISMYAGEKLMDNVQELEGERGTHNFIDNSQEFHLELETQSVLDIRMSVKLA